MVNENGEGYLETEEGKRLLQQAAIFDNKQSLEKLKMNSTYGKLAFNSVHSVTNMITGD